MMRLKAFFDPCEYDDALIERALWSGNKMEFKLTTGKRIAVDTKGVAAVLEDSPTKLVLVNGVSYDIVESFDEAHDKLRGK